jgi:hypothetical protein
MIRKILSLFLFCSISLLAAALPDALLDRFDIPHNLSDQELVQITQQLWCQKGKERWEFEARFEERHDELAPIFQEMGYLDRVAPKKTHYDYALVHGATLKTLELRVKYLETLIEQGLEVKQIVFLSGMRKLLDVEKVAAHLAWESDLTHWVYDHSTLPRKIPVVFINAPEKLVQGNLVRPTTGDTIFEWLKQTPEAGSCLAISNQPLVPYQDAVAKNSLPHGFTLETVGEETKYWKVALVLDSIAKTVYEEKKSSTALLRTRQ